MVYRGDDTYVRFPLCYLTSHSQVNLIWDGLWLLKLRPNCRPMFLSKFIQYLMGYHDCTPKDIFEVQPYKAAVTDPHFSLRNTYFRVKKSNTQKNKKEIKQRV